MDEKTAGRMVGLPANRAFVVQLAVSVGAEPPIRGRIEHLASGSVTHFEFLTQLGRVVRVLASAAAGPADAARRTIGRRIAMDRMNAEAAATRTHSSSGSHSSRNAAYVSRRRGMVTSRFLMTLLSLILALVTQPCRSAEIPAGQVDAIVQEALKAWQVPGAAVAIVRGDEVIYLKGHGVRELGKPDPVTPETLFAIGSTTKAFTATAVGMLVDEGKMGWDDLVRTHVEFFHLADPLADANVTLRDLLCHRTGLGLHQLLWHGSPWGREELIRRTGRLQLDRPFRSTWLYANLTFLTAGYAVGLTSNSSWEAFVQRRIFDPLGMNGANFSTTVAEKAPNRATPHRKSREGPMTTIPWRNIDNVGPAGSINAGARDMARWVRFQLGDGTFEGKRLLTAATLEETHTPQMVRRIPPAAREEDEQLGLRPSTYGLGWFIRDYRGHSLVYHGGNIEGFSALVALLPRDHLGIVALTNRDVTQLPSAVAYSLFDRALGLPKTDWNAELGRQEKQREEQEAAAAKALAERRRPDTKPSRELAAYASAYTDAAYGTANVSVENGALVLRWNGSTAPLEHFHYDTFSLMGNSPLITEIEAPKDRQVFFTLGADGDVATLNFLGRAFKSRGKATATFEPGPCPQTPQPVPGFDKASCGVLTVPENRQNDNGRTIRLTVVRVPAAVSHTPPLEPILFLAGGPGNSAVLDAHFVTNLDVEVQRDHEVIFMSARGTWGSTPFLNCPEVEGFERAFPGLRYGSDAARDGRVRAVRECHDRLVAQNKGIDLSAYNTTESATDYAELRTALGIREWHVVGHSFGTYLAQELMRTHPDGIRSVFLEGITPTARESTEYWAWESLKESLDNIFRACGEQPPCAAHYPQLSVQLNELATKLEASPFRTTAKGPDGQPVDVVLDGGALMAALRRCAFNPADVPLVIDEAAKGNPQKLAQRWADKSAPPPPSARGTFSHAFHYSVTCSESITYTTASAELAKSQQLFPGFPDSLLRFGPQFAFFRDVCGAWPVRKAPAAVRQPVKSSIRTLIMVGTFDPSTSARNGDDIKNSGIFNSTIVRMNGAPHGAFFFANPCGPDVMKSFFNNPNAPDLSCVASVKPGPFMVNP